MTKITTLADVVDARQLADLRDIVREEKAALRANIADWRFQLARRKRLHKEAIDLGLPAQTVAAYALEVQEAADYLAFYTGRE